jgi:nicotinate-nucleotide pyrophosphorylase (carboxylating)
LKSKLYKKSVPIEIEVANLKELNDLLRGDFIPNRILLDNFSILNLRRAVRIVRNFKKKVGAGPRARLLFIERAIPGAHRGAPLLEASGGITLKNVRRIAKTGVDRISIGALTHSAPALDFSLTVSNVITK